MLTIVTFLLPALTLSLSVMGTFSMPLVPQLALFVTVLEKFIAGHFSVFGQ